MGKETAKRAAALANHFSCWRSTPTERRKRTIMEAADATKQRGKRSATVLTTSRRSRAGSIPTGLMTFGVPVRGPGEKAKERVSRISTAPENHATGRQRRVRQTPVGEEQDQKGP